MSFYLQFLQMFHEESSMNSKILSKELETKEVLLYIFS